MTARTGLILFLITLVVGVAYFGSKVEAVTVPTTDIIDNNRSASGFLAENVERVELTFEAERSATSRARAFKATAYCLRGKTASGRHVRRGMVAADPRILPLGTRIHMSGGRYTGNYLVADTGGRIKGRVLDIWVPSCSEARRWGRRTVQVRVTAKKKSKKNRRRRG
ncbi:MAG: 3D domain-containing protein [Acidobacteriota bacterium]|nr:3D domain-containing protein [Acidobacteriota bacterium]